MRRILFTTITALTLCTAGAMAQTPAPVPNASGSQVTNPNTYGATANQPKAAKRKVTKKRPMAATGSVRAGSSSSMGAGPVPNASGSQTTNPNTYGNTKRQ